MAKQSPVTKLLRKLRPLLPGKAVKKDATTYLIDDVVEVNLEYYCPWRLNGAEKKQQIGVCIPNAIVVRLATNYPEKFDPIQFGARGDIFKSRSFKKRTDGTFNLEGISAAVTKAVKAMNDALADKKDKANQEQAKEKLVDAAASRIRKEVKNKKLVMQPSVFNNNHVKLLGLSQDDDADFCVSSNTKGEPEVDIHFDSLTPTQAIRILNLLTPKEVKLIKENK